MTSSLSKGASASGLMGAATSCFATLPNSGLVVHYWMKRASAIRSKGTVWCVHGFPDTSFGWRKQIAAIAASGYDVVVPDQKGYGLSSSPHDKTGYSMKELCSFNLELADLLGVRIAIWLGHDWGGTLVWAVARHFPERCRAVAAVCTPLFPIGKSNPWRKMQDAAAAGKLGRFEYQWYFQQRAAEVELGWDPRRTISFFLRSVGVAAANGLGGFATSGPIGKGLMRDAPHPLPENEMLTEGELQTYAEQFSRTGFVGPLCWYRNVEENWKWDCELKSKGTQRVKVDCPCLMLSAERDEILKPSMVTSLRMNDAVPKLQHEVVHGAGHWVLQEKPDEVNSILASWLAGLPEEARPRL